MNATKLNSGKYRARAYDYTDSKGKKHYKSFTCDSKKLAERLATEYELRKKDNIFDDITVGEAIDKYISLQTPTLSETTIYGYKKIRRNAFPELMEVYVGRLTNLMLRNAVNGEIQRGLAPKTVINNYGLVRAALKTYNPGLNTTVNLPRREKKIVDLPEAEDVVRAVKGKNIELAALLAMWLSFSLSEVRGLKRSSIYGDYIQVDQVIVNTDKKIEKTLAKVDSRTRRHRIPDYIKVLIDKLPDEQEYLVPQCGSTLNSWLNKALTDAGVPVVSFHKLRHLFASICLSKLGINSEVVKTEGGWSNETTMRNVYTHSFNADRIEADKKIDEYFNDMLNHVEKKELPYEDFIILLSLEDKKESKELYKNYLKVL